MDRLTQLEIERKLADGLATLPESTRAIISAWYRNAIEDVQNGIVENRINDDDLKITMEAVNYAIKGFRQGS